MVDSYSSNLLPTRAIYTSRYFHYIALLCGAKFFRSFGIFLTYDLLKLIHIVQLLFFIKAGSAVFLVVLQKPFSSGKRINKHQWFRVVRHAFLGTVIGLLWLFGLTLCGPLRTLLLFEHSDLVIVAGASALFTNSSSPSRFRGAVFFIMAVTGILLFDHDDHLAHANENPETHREAHNGILAHLFEHFSNLTGLNDHKGGVVLLFCTLCLHVGFNSAAKKLSVDVGGAKRLHALSTFVSAIMLFPWNMFVFMTGESLVTSWWSMLIPLVLVILLVAVIDYYVEAACVNKLELSRTCRFGAFAAFTSALLLSGFWNHPFVSKVTTMRHLNDIIAEEHVLSGGVVFSFVLFMFATHILTTQLRGANKGSFVGYSAGGLPLYNFTGERIQKTSHSVILILRNGLRQILEDSDSRKIFYFLCINLSFTFVELIYGVWTNSLGLISDGFHMLFDCSALVMGLYAAVMARWKATRIFSYGYDRVEILSGFINGLFLVVIAFFVFSAAITRVIDPPDISTERLLVVSVAGLVVNLFGICAFQHGHSHGGGGGGHGHSHGGHGHSHGGHAHGNKGQSQAELTHNTNMQGVFLHVLADTLGSVGVIISTILIENLGWKVADPICSLFIASLIFLSVLPLVKETALILLLRTPVELESNVAHALQKLVSIEGVVSYRDEHFWRHSSKVICGTIHVQVRADSSEQKLTSQVTSLLKEAGVTNLTLQIEKETYFHHMQGLGMNFRDIYEVNRNRDLLTYGKSDFAKGM